MCSNITIPLVIASNDKYAIGVATCLYSILSNTKVFVDIFVLDENITNKNKTLIKKSLSQFDNFNITFVDMGNFKLQRFPQILHYGSSAYSRYFLADICKDYDKIIYTDADVIFLCDIVDYFNVDLKDKGLAAVSEETGVKYNLPWNHEYRKHLFGINPDHKYFANGNIIISGNYWRQNNISDKLVQKTIEWQKDLKAPDLDVMNMVFERNYVELDLKYCVCAHAWEQRNVNEKLQEAFAHPFIIHYTGREKPWVSCSGPFFSEYLKIVKNTAFANDIMFIYYKKLLLKLIRKLFSITNSGKHKVITILGIKINIKRKQHDT